MDFIIIFCLIIAIVFGGIALVIKIGTMRSDKEEQIEQKRKSESQHQLLIKKIDDKTWVFPAIKLKNEFQRNNIKYPISNELISVANTIIINLLTQMNIPAKYHSDYIGEAKINEYLLDIDKREFNDIVRRVQKISREHNLAAISSEASYQKAKIIMQKVLSDLNLPKEKYDYYMTREQIELCFQETDKKNKSNAEIKQQRKIKRLREKEKEFEKQCIEWVEYIGKEKSISYCKTQIAIFEQEIKQCKAELDGLTQETAERSIEYRQVKNNWATHGGIASAIAGPVAGAVIAVDAKNRIDAQNQRNAELSRINMELLMLNAQEIKSRQKRAEDELEYWKETLKFAEFALEEWQDEEYLLSSIDPFVENYAVTETGAVKLVITYSPIPDLLVYNEKPAFVDGSFYVNLKKDGEIAGKAICCLPFKGTTSSYMIDCICTETTDPNAKYEIDFSPKKLWAMEKI